MSFVLFLILCLILIWLWRRTTGKSSSGWNILTAPGTLVRTRIVFNGQQYSSVDEMPAGVRQAYEQAMGVLADSNRDGIPDLFETNGGATVLQTDLHVDTLGDAVERSRKLREMGDSGLITKYEMNQPETQSSITLKPEQCPNCGADLNPCDYRDVVRCAYCGTVLEPHS